MTAAGTLPKDATDQLVQADVVAVKYVAPADPGPGIGDCHAARTADVLAGLLAGHQSDVHE